MNVLLALILIILYLFLYTIFGQAFLSLFKIKTKSLIFTTLIGFFVYYSVFQLIALPLKILLFPLLTLSIAWIIVVVMITLVVMITARKELLLKISGIKTVLSDNKTAFFVIFAIIAFQLLAIGLNWFPGSGWDMSFYIGEVTSSLYTNTIEQYDAYTGQMLMRLNPNYLLENYEVHSAVMCQISGIHPLVEVRTVMTSIIVILSNGIIFETAYTLFKKNYFKVAIMMLIAMIINIANVSAYSPSSFFFNRTYEGKTLLGCVIIYMIFYLLIRFVMDRRKNGVWAALFIVVFASFCMNSSSVFVVSAAVVVFFVPAIIIKKQLKCFINFAICLMPCIAMAIFTYLLNIRLITIMI